MRSLLVKDVPRSVLELARLTALAEGVKLRTWVIAAMRLRLGLPAEPPRVRKERARMAQDALPEPSVTSSIPPEPAPPAVSPSVEGVAPAPTATIRRSLPYPWETPRPGDPHPPTCPCPACRLARFPAPPRP